VAALVSEPGERLTEGLHERLQKILASAGYGSRRQCEALIAAGRVTVNGAHATLGMRADPAADRIEVDGRALAAAAVHVHLAMHKPAGVVTTARDPHGRRTVMDLLPADLPPHVLPVGRLDQDTSGLLIFTNDGELAHRLAHPRYEIEKEYAALVDGTLDARALAALRRGVDIGGHVTRPARVEAGGPPAGWKPREGFTWLRLIIHEGRKRQVRLMCAAVGHPVRELVRTRVGPVRLGRLPVGSTRPLTPTELSRLRSELAR
jgi:23S rRNA pseudouridine2605 synthase